MPDGILTDAVAGMVKNLNALLMVGLPQSKIRGGISPMVTTPKPPKQEVEFKKNVQQFNQSNQKVTGISLPKLIGDFRGGTIAPVLFTPNSMSGR
jgi:hypothetical protein